MLPEEVSPDASSAKRSQTTGHLLVRMPKVSNTPILHVLESFGTNTDYHYLCQVLKAGLALKVP